MANLQRRWVGLGVGTAVLLLVIVGLAGRGQVPEVQTARVVRESLEAGISSNGKVEPIQPDVVHAEIATFVEKISATEGQSVHRGQVVLTLNADDARARLAEAREALVTAQESLRAARAGGTVEEVAKLESDLRKSQAQVKSLQVKNDALEKLVAKQAATQEELEQNRLALASAQSDWQVLQQKRQDLSRRSSLDAERAGLRVQQATADTRSLDQKVRSAAVTSPVDGTLYNLPVHTGDYVKVGDVLAEMADLHKLRVRAFVDEPDLGWLAPGQAIEITWDAMHSRVWKGQTELIPKQVIARGTRSVGEVLCSVDNSRLELLPNTNVNVRIRVKEKNSALVVPRAAVRTDGPHRYAFVVQDNRLHQREITVGIASATKYEVLSGLAQGDVVALLGDLELKDGKEVRAVESK